VETLLHLGLSNALAAAVLGLIVAAVGWVVRRPAVTHSLWLLVLLKLLMPPLWVITIPWPSLPAATAVPAPRAAAPEPLPAANEFADRNGVPVRDAAPEGRAGAPAEE